MLDLQEAVMKLARTTGEARPWTSWLPALFWCPNRRVVSDSLAVMSTRARFIDPMLLLRSANLPDGDDWLIELKLDGYRAIAFKAAGKIHLRSRNDKDFGARYSQIVKITFLSAGTCSITAFVPGSSSLYTAATPVTQSFIVSGYQLTTSVSPANSGTITISPVSTGNYYAPGSSVCLTVSPAAGEIFTGWTGTLPSAAGCLAVNANASVTANFEANPITGASALRFVPVAPCRHCSGWYGRHDWIIRYQ
jgi:hypothetical protein